MIIRAATNEEIKLANQFKAVAISVIKLQEQNLEVLFMQEMRYKREAAGYM
jgi:glucokinase